MRFPSTHIYFSFTHLQTLQIEGIRSAQTIHLLNFVVSDVEFGEGGQVGLGEVYLGQVVGGEGEGVQFGEFGLAQAVHLGD